MPPRPSSLSGGRPGATQLLPLLLAVASGYPGPARCALHPPADSLARLGASARGAWSCKKGGLGEQVSTGFLGWGWRASEPGRPALTFLQLFLVVRLWLGGHDLKEGLQDAPQVAGVVGLQLVGHACGGRGEGRGGTADCGACCSSGPEASPSLDEPGREAAPQPRKGPSGRSQVQEVREEGMGPRPSSAAPFPPGQQLVSFILLSWGSQPWPPKGSGSSMRDDPAPLSVPTPVAAPSPSWPPWPALLGTCPDWGALGAAPTLTG